MSPELIGLIGIIVLLLLIACKMWVGAAMALVSVIGIIILKNTGVAWTAAGTSAFKNLNTYAFTVIPMFTLMGAVVAGGDYFVIADDDGAVFAAHAGAALLNGVGYAQIVVFLACSVHDPDLRIFNVNIVIKFGNNVNKKRRTEFGAAPDFILPRPPFCRGTAELCTRWRQGPQEHRRCG